VSPEVERESHRLPIALAKERLDVRCEAHRRSFGRNAYDVTLPGTQVVNVDASRWRMQVGARVAF
jgi:hypothetical protein